MKDVPHPPNHSAENGLFRLLASEWTVVIAILLLAAFFRFYELDSIPPGLHYDEAGEGLDALSMLRKGFRVFSETQGGREPFFAYLLALAFSLWQPQVIILRAAGALFGTLAVGASYLLTRQLFKPFLPAKARYIAALTALGYALSYWQVHLTRMGLRHVLLPVFIALGFYFLWRGFYSGKRLPFLLSGLILGGSLYTYLSARFIPIFLALFLLAEGVARAIEGKPAAALWRKHWKNLALSALLALLVFAPLGAYFLRQEPGEFLERSAQVSIFNPQLNQGNLWTALKHSFTANYGAIAFFGDADGLVNLPGRPMFTPLMAIAFFTGLLLAIRRFRQPVYLFLILWWGVMMLPAALTYDRVPRFMRAIGVVPGIYIFPALTWVALWSVARHSSFVIRRTLQVIAVLLPLLAYAWCGVSTYRDYFLRWGPGDIAAERFYAPYRELAEKMTAEGQPDELWIFPTDIRINYPRRHRYILRYIGYGKLPPEKFLMVDEQKVFNNLTRSAAGMSRVILVDMKTGLQKEADPKHLLPFLLEKYGTLERTASGNEYNLLYYALDAPNAVFEAAETWQPVNARFGDSLMLKSAAFGNASGSGDVNLPQTPAGQSAWVTLRWQSDTPLPEDYHVSLKLVDAAGQIIARRDAPLFSRWHLPPTGWHPHEEVVSYLLLPVPPATAPGRYTLHVLVYPPDTLQPLPAAQNSSVSGAATIGDLRVAPALEPPDPASFTNPGFLPVNAAWLPGLTLFGIDPLPKTPLRPGDRLDLGLWWQSSAPLEQDAALNVCLRPEQGGQCISLLDGKALGSAAFPTSQWRSGETMHQWLHLLLPAELESGAYSLLLNAPAGETIITLGTVTLAGRPRLFDLPPKRLHPLDVTLGGQINLAGFNLTSPAAGELELTLYWQATTSLAESYTVFVHILDEKGQIVAQQDRLPCSGEAPTTGWLPNEVIVDPYRFAADTGYTLPPGTYRVAAGMYNAATGQRLSISETPDNRLILPEQVVVN